MRDCPRAGDVARKDVPTTGLRARLGDVRDRGRAMGWDAIVAVNEERVVWAGVCLGSSRQPQR